MERQAPICATLVEQKRLDLLPKDAESSLLEEVLKALKPSKDVTAQVPAEKYVTTSATHPPLHHLTENALKKWKVQTLLQLLVPRKVPCFAEWSTEWSRRLVALRKRKQRCQCTVEAKRARREQEKVQKKKARCGESSQARYKLCSLFMLDSTVVVLELWLISNISAPHGL